MQPRIVRDPRVEGQFGLFNVRLAFTQDLNAARAQQAQPGQSPGKPKFGCTVLIPESAVDVLQEILKLMQELATRTWGQQAASVWQELQAGNKLALKNGALKATTAGFAGNWFLTPSAKEETPPVLLSRYNDPATGKPQVLSRPQNVIYSGCYGNVQIGLWAQNNGYGKRINSDLKVVQFAADGESFGGGVAVANTDMFGGEDAPPAFGGAAPVAAPVAAFPGPAFGAPQAPAFAAPQAAPSMGAFAPGGFQL